MSKVIGFAVTIAFLCGNISFANAAGDGWVTCKDGMKTHGGGECASHGGELIELNTSTPIDASKAPTPTKTAKPKKSAAQKTAAAKPKKTSAKRTSGPTAKCNDGAMYYSTEHRGACAKHGGVHSWF